jgi:hypothetical protein
MCSFVRRYNSQSPLQNCCDSNDKVCEETISKNSFLPTSIWEVHECISLCLLLMIYILPDICWDEMLNFRLKEFDVSKYFFLNILSSPRHFVTPHSSLTFLNIIWELLFRVRFRIPKQFICWMQEEKVLQVTSFNKSSITIPISPHSKVRLFF